MMKPENNLKNNEWYSLNLSDLENFMGYKLSDYVLVLQNNLNPLIPCSQDFLNKNKQMLLQSEHPTHLQNEL